MEPQGTPYLRGGANWVGPLLAVEGVLCKCEDQLHEAVMARLEVPALASNPQGGSALNQRSLFGVYTKPVGV